jgi:hypothetical protein
VTSRTEEETQLEFSDTNRKKVEDKKIDGNLTDAELSNLLFVRLVAKEKEFTKIDFKYCIFDTCYLRQCLFDRCDFTGCRFVGTSFYGSRFSGCKFDYSIFERTIVATDLLRDCCPAPENLKMKFARTLRVNYQQLGDAQAANIAIHVELEATSEHLWKRGARMIGTTATSIRKGRGLKRSSTGWDLSFSIGFGAMVKVHGSYSGLS